MRRALEKLKVPCTAQSADDFVRRTIDEGRTRGEDANATTTTANDDRG